ncbi:ABC transporter permease subunit [Agrobacterium tumefaciens]|uniref:ABC transporter permease n=1 Tax=Agrobacterium tumefaciens TaxID=358 RepID=UPI00287BCB5C|nr:ABC transporter permease subunit [Agrobacterium tumefaciens]MDS7594822.1 ABC transporter permease subunit [Agrobacterium tumefaciens]
MSEVVERAAAPLAETAASRRPVGLLLVAIPVFLVIWLVIWPAINAISRTMWRTDADGRSGFDLSSYAFFFSDGYSLDNLAVTLWTTIVCAVLLLVICLPIALYLRFSQGRLPAYVQALAILPMFVPSIILAFAFIRVLGPNGMLDILLNAVGLPKIRTPYLTPWGPVIGLVWDNIPLTVLILLSGLGSVANQSIEAARDIGANAYRVFWHIILPRISNSILVALSFSVLGIFSSFTLPYLLGPASPEMLGPFMQRTLRDVQDPIGAMTQAVVAFGFCIVFGLFYVRSVARNRGK